MDKITEIRIEEIFDEENNQHYYWIYYFKNGEVKIIGKSSVNHNVTDKSRFVCNIVV